jgi:hypothetical protein
MLPSATVDGGTVDDIKRFIGRGLKTESWPILQFHGVGGDHGQNFDPTAFREIVQWLNTQRIAVQTISTVIGDQHV